MRLLQLNSEDNTWKLVDFPGPQVPFYAILSHTWGRDNDEVKFEDIESGQRKLDDTSKRGYDKLRFCFNRAQVDGLSYFWIDTCCIKKSDSTELQRSLASMFYWYQRAARCYVWLSDVSINGSTDDFGNEWQLAFSKSRWFQRGWTLQELIAPRSIVFFSKEEELIGDKEDLAETISKVTEIPSSALKNVDLSRFSVEERLSWSKGRRTTVAEDSAYCLIGIFDVELLTMYAEGDYNKRKTAAMSRLHNAITEKNKHADSHEEVIRIGGASWSDLSTLSEPKLKELDADLDEYQEWLLNEPARYSKEGSNIDKHLPTFSQDADKRMRVLLAKYEVRYEDLSGPDIPTRSWAEAWRRYQDEQVPSQARVQELVANRRYWMMHNEYGLKCVTAARTFEDLKIWRGIWKKWNTG